MGRKQVGHWRARQAAWSEDARYLQSEIDRLDNEGPWAFMFDASEALVAACRAMDKAIWVMSNPEGE